MDPFSLAALSFGSSALSSVIGYQDQQAATSYANQQTRLANQTAMQNWQYEEQMRQRQNEQARAVYDMKVQNYELQKELDYNAYRDYYYDSQLNFNNLVRDVKNKSFTNANKLAEYQSQSMASALSRGSTGRRSSVRSANAAIKSGMTQRSLTDKLIFAEEQMDEGIERAAKTTNLRIKQAFNNIGPAPTDLPMAPMPVMNTMQDGPSGMGLALGLAQGAISAVGTYGSLKAPKTGTPAPQWGGIPYALPG